MAGKTYSREYYLANKEAIRATQKRYRERKKLREAKKNAKVQRISNPRLFDMREDYKTPTRQDFKEVIQPKMTKAMEYYYANREKVLAQQKASRKRRKINAKQREYYAKNREHICAMQKKNRDRKNREKRLTKSFFGRMVLKVERFVRGK